MQAKVLVVEDVNEMSDLISLFLSKDGLDAIPCENAESALERLKTERFDSIVLDLNLPGMDGFEFLAEARKLTACPVLIVTARASDEDLIASLGQGADEYMTKPFSPKVLVARVRALLRRSRSASDKISPDIFRFGPYTLDRSAFVLKRGDAAIPLGQGIRSPILSRRARKLGSTTDAPVHLRRRVEIQLWGSHGRSRLYPAAQEEDRGRSR